MHLGFLKRSLRLVERFAGKSEEKVVAVFGLSSQTSDRAVRHIRAGAGEIPVWLFCTSEPDPDTAALCERVFVRPSSLATLLEAQSLLWHHRVALSVGTWTGEDGGWSYKLAPFLIPPFRSLFMNSNADFVNGNSAAVLVHAWRQIEDGVCTFSCGVREAAHDASDALSLAGRRAWGSVRSAGYTIADALRAAGVSTAAILLRLTGNPHRAWFRRIHGNANPGIVPAESRGIEQHAVRLCASGRDWHADAVEAEVAATNARWLIWNEPGSPYDIEDLLPLFDDERTFAVSAQRHFRGWSPSLVFTAPFRQLQPGEAACVLAPLSDTIVIDRAKMAALPVPRCGLSATAWLDIFWRAAAAGWRSYSVGQCTPAVPQPDYPAPEAEFFFRMLADAGLRQLGPQDPDLIRGNLAFHLPARTTPGPGRLRVLVVSPFLPFPLSHGGAVRIWNLCRALRDRVDFFLVAVRERDEPVDYAALGEVFREVHTVDLDELPSGSRHLPQQVRHHQSRSLAALIRDLSGRLHPDLIQIEYTHLAHFVDAQPDIPRILVEHDITFSLYSQLMETDPGRSTRLEYDRWRAYEGRYLGTFNAVWTMSEEDRRAALREGSRPDSTFTVPNGVDTARFIPRSDVAEEPEILYVGSFRHLPNLIGFEILCAEVMPQVWQRHPHARLRVVAGPQHEMFWQRFRGSALAGTDPRIDIHGFVSDLRPFYASASVVAVPLAVSAGTNIKVLEAMACGKAIVSTPVGCAGLCLCDGAELLVREAAGFAAAICQLLENDARRADLGSVARRTAEQRFSWKAIADRAYQSYLDVWAPVAWEEIGTKAS